MSDEGAGGVAATGAASEVAPTAFTDVLSATFQQSIADGSTPEEAFLAAQEACEEVATSMGIPAADVAANLEAASETFTAAVDAGTDPAAAMVSAAGQAATSMGMEPGVAGGDATDIISGAMGAAYDAAIESGSTPAEAFALGKEAAETAAVDCGIDPTAQGPFLDTMTSVQATFTDAMSTGADPAAAMAGAQGMMGAGPALSGDPALMAANPAFSGPLDAGFAGGMPEGFAPPSMSVGADGQFIQPPTMGDAMMMGPGGVPMVNPAMMQPGAMECVDGEYHAADPLFFPPPPFGDPSFIAPTPGMPGFEAFSSLATQIGLDPAAASAPGFIPPLGTPGMDQPGMPGSNEFNPETGGFVPPTFEAPEGFEFPVVPVDGFTAPSADFFDAGAFPPVGGTELGIGSFGGPVAAGADGFQTVAGGPGLTQDAANDPNFVVPDGTQSGLDTAFAPELAPTAPTFDPVADAVGGAIDAGAQQGASPAPEPAAQPVFEPAPTAEPEPVQDDAPPAADPIV